MSQSQLSANSKLRNFFLAKNRPTIIGVVHCSPLCGYTKSPGLEVVEKKFMQDLRALISGGIDAILIENNYDVPHFEEALRSTIPQLTDLCLKARKLTKKPLGLCVLWNDFKTALSIAKIADLNFIRVPVFVDKVKTDYGIFSANPDECIRFRKMIGAESILIFADVQVKHAEHLIKRSLSSAVKEAIQKKADGIIITGKWTGDPPLMADVREAKKIAGRLPVLLGSGITADNISNYDVDGIIMASYFKGEGDHKEKDFHNIFPWQTKIQKRRVKKFMYFLKTVKGKEK